MTSSARTAAYVLVALLVGAAIAGVAVHFNGKARSAEQRAAQAEADRQLALEQLRAFQRAESIRHDSIAIETAHVLDSLGREQRRLSATAREIRDRIAPPDTTVGDSLRYWRSTAVAALDEVAALRTALEYADTVRAIDETRIRAMEERWLREMARGDSLAQALRRLTVAIPGRAPECRILWVLECPSRTTTAVLALATGYAVHELTDERRRRQ